MVFDDPDRNATQLTRYALAARIPARWTGASSSVEYQPLVRLDDGQLHGVEALRALAATRGSARSARTGSSRWPRRPA